MSIDTKGVKELFKDVIEQGLCTGCGACLGSCPYIVQHEGKIIQLDKCSVQEGKCYRYCPRTYTDMNAISEKIFGGPYSKSEVGHVLDIHMIRSTNHTFLNAGQDGGTVTTLLSVALQEGIIDCVVCTRMDENKVPHGYVAKSVDDLISCAGSSYESGFALEAYRKIPKEKSDTFGIVGVGCQIESISKMKTDIPENSANPDNIKLVIGLFCGWSLSQKTFHPYLEKNFDVKRAIKFDIPHSPNYTFDVYNEIDKKSVTLDEIKPYINPACQYCWDMTAEFADISVGSAGSEFPGWNTIIIRTQKGVDLIDLAKKNKIIECKSLPEKRLAHLKSVSSKRKKTAFKNIINKTGNKKDLLYVGGLSEDIIKKNLDE
jgi:coenzyme F420 hydrogenase subunit beta